MTVSPVRDQITAAFERSSKRLADATASVSSEPTAGEVLARLNTGIDVFATATAEALIAIGAALDRIEGH